MGKKIPLRIRYGEELKGYKNETEILLCLLAEDYYEVSALSNAFKCALTCACYC